MANCAYLYSEYLLKALPSIVFYFTAYYNYKAIVDFGFDRQYKYSILFKQKLGLVLSIMVLKLAFITAEMVLYGLGYERKEKELMQQCMNERWDELTVHSAMLAF